MTYSFAVDNIDDAYSQFQAERQSYLDALVSAGGTALNFVRDAYINEADAEEFEFLNNVASESIVTNNLSALQTTTSNILAAVGPLDSAIAALAAAQTTLDEANQDFALMLTMHLTRRLKSSTTRNALLSALQVTRDDSDNEVLTQEQNVTNATNAVSTANTALSQANTALTAAGETAAIETVERDAEQAILDGLTGILNDFIAVRDARQLDLDAALFALNGATGAIFAANQAVLDLQAAQEAETAAQAALTLAVEAEAAASTVASEEQATLDALIASIEPEEARLAELIAALEAAQNALDAARSGNAILTEYVGLLDLGSSIEIDNLISYIRGQEIDGYRSRVTDINNDGVLERDLEGNPDEFWRLGDIVHSSPALVSVPGEGYDVLFGDSTYAAFREQYKDRRHVIYVGANDGMLHAFNAGFFNRQRSSFDLSLNGETPHPLGSELWAFIPQAALPHLRWLSDPGYGHTYYVDGEPIVFDANIFPRDGAHPFGWGTVLMVGMRFGGGEIRVDRDGDGVNDETLSSSYMLFDVTNPEQPPVFMGEITHPDLEFATSRPTVIKKRVPSGATFEQTSTNEWFVAFGSGPSNFRDGTGYESTTTDQEANSPSTDPNATQHRAHLFVYDLTSGEFINGFDGLDVGAGVSGGSYTSNFAVQDSNSDFVDDIVYFGVNGGSPLTGTRSALKRARLDVSASSSVSTVFETEGSISAAPTTARDAENRSWVLFGAGRFLATIDNTTSFQQSYYGIFEPTDPVTGGLLFSEVSASNLENVTDIIVNTDGTVSRNGNTFQIPSGTTVETFNDLIAAIGNNRSGWQLDFEIFTQNNNSRSERVIGEAATISNLLLFTSYTPGAEQCIPEGFSRLYAIDYRAGVPPFFAPLDPDNVTDPSSPEPVEAFVDLGRGLASGVSVTGGEQVTTTKSTSEIRTLGVEGFGPGSRIRASWRRLRIDREEN